MEGHTAETHRLHNQRKKIGGVAGTHSAKENEPSSHDKLLIGTLKANEKEVDQQIHGEEPYTPSCGLPDSSGMKQKKTIRQSRLECGSRHVHPLMKRNK